MTLISDSVQTGERHLPYRDLVDESLWDRLVSRTVESLRFRDLFSHLDAESQMDRSRRMTNEMLGYLKARAARPDIDCGPSPLVDIPWHVFLIHTLEYKDFCESLDSPKPVGQRFIHHRPLEPDDEVMPPPEAQEVLYATMKQLGGIDMELWNFDDAGHSQKGKVPCF